METSKDTKSHPWSGKETVGNPLLSERDGNCSISLFTISFPPPSETHYSLKEMETSRLAPEKYRYWLYVGNPLLSERDGNSLNFTK